MARYQVSISDLRAHLDPLRGEMWKCAPIKITDVEAAVAADDFDVRPWTTVKDDMDPKVHRDFHISRIAYLVSHAAPVDDSYPVLIAIAPDRVWVYDGNHRLAAAIVRGDETMIVGISSYDAAQIQKYFPSARPSP
jgi:hypothetical protein